MLKQWRWRNYFFLVISAHLLLFLSCAIVLVQPVLITKPEMDQTFKAEKILPSYVYAAAAPGVTADTAPAMQTAVAEPLAPKASATPATPVSTSSHALTQHGELSTADGGAPETGTANLVADDPTDKPLIKILSRATGAKLLYPKVAQDFQIMGTVKISFYLTPAGAVNQVTLLQSSGNHLLDDAALYAVNHIAPVAGVNAYLKRAKTLTVGIIFGD